MGIKCQVSGATFVNFFLMKKLQKQLQRVDGITTPSDNIEQVARDRNGFVACTRSEFPMFSRWK
jgi:nicotinate-nucleotide pyrophosphorylase